MKIRLQISYDGTDFAGWQRQGPKSADPRPTLQATLEDAVSKIFSQEIKIQASGRTDAGVHAEAQTLHFQTPDNITEDKIKNMKLLRSLNALTPDALAINKAWIAPDDFHALRSSVKKTYRYVIHNSPTPNPLRHRYSYWMRKPLDVQKLNAITECLVGEHDFKSFQTRGTELKTTVRKLKDVHWERQGDLITFHITGNGFLKQMVRNIVGTSIYLHQNSENPQEMQKILESCDRQQAKDTAPAQGLFLEAVYYPPELDNKCREL
jgi:tRNA pseudouridine38-40 synthase